MDNKKIENFIAILNIPIKNDFNTFFEGAGDFNWYYYLYDLQILDKQNYELLISEKTEVKRNKYLESYLNQAFKNYDLKDSADKEVIVDLGCGWGFLTFWFAQFTNKKIYAIGYDWQIKFIQKVLDFAIKENLLNTGSEITLCLEPIKNNSVILSSKIASESVDKVILNDVIEHFHPSLYPNLAITIFNALKNEGRLISPSHNSDNYKVLNKLKSYWEKNEAEYLVNSRLAFIKETFPQISKEDSAKLSLVSRGYTKEMFVSSIKYFLMSNTILPVNKALVPVDIKIDNYLLENYVSPMFFKNFFSKYGFTVKLEPCLYSSRRYKYFIPFAKLAPQLFLKMPYFSSSVLITAVKEK